MGFLLTLACLVIIFLTPAAFGVQGGDVRLVLVIELVSTAVALFYIPSARIFRTFSLYFVIGLTVAASLSLLPVWGLGGSFFAFRTLLPFNVIFFLIALTVRTPRQLEILTLVMAGICIFVLAHGLAEMLSGFPGGYIMEEHVAKVTTTGVVFTFITRFRGLGMINDPNDFGQFMVCLIPLLFIRWKRNAMVANFLLSLLPALILVAGIYATRSRGTTVALLFVLAFAFKDKLSLVASTILAGVATLALIALGLTGGRGITNDDGSRIGFWAQSLQLFKHNPILGIGFGRVTDFTENHMTSHNSFVLSAAETGLLGYFFWMGLLVISWMSLSNILKRRREQQKAEREAKANQNTGLPYRTRAMPVPALAASTAGAAALPSPVPAAPRMRSYGRPPVGAASYLRNLRLDAQDQDMQKRLQMEHMANCVRLSLVALLVTCFFLSRTYSAFFYTLTGIATAAVQMWPDDVSPTVKQIFTYVPALVLGSLGLIYMVVRLHGGH